MLSKNTLVFWIEKAENFVRVSIYSEKLAPKRRGSLMNGSNIQLLYTKDRNDIV